MNAFLAHRDYDLDRCRKAAKYIKRIGGLFADLAALHELRDVLFSPDESGGMLDRRIAEVERGPQT